MKLSEQTNLDCIRDVLLYLEEHLTITPELEIKSLSLGEIEQGLPYSREELAETIAVLGDAGFIVEMCNTSVSRITYAGYQFLESIRPKPVWEETVSIIKQLGFFSLKLIEDVSTEIIKSKLSSLLH